MVVDNKHPLPEANKSGPEPDNSATRQQWDVLSKESFIGAANLQFLEPIQAPVRAAKSVCSLLYSNIEMVLMYLSIQCLSNDRMKTQSENH